MNVRARATASCLGITRQVRSKIGRSNVAVAGDRLESIEPCLICPQATRARLVSASLTPLKVTREIALSLATPDHYGQCRLCGWSPQRSPRAAGNAVLGLASTKVFPAPSYNTPDSISTTNATAAPANIHWSGWLMRCALLPVSFFITRASR